MLSAPWLTSLTEVNEVHFDNNPKLEVAHLNARSICNKTLAINDFIVDCNLDVLAVTETWLCPSKENITVGEVTPPGYSMYHIPRATGSRGGGVGVIVRDTLKVVQEPVKAFKSFEHIHLRISYSPVIIALYPKQIATDFFFQKCISLWSPN